MKKTPRINPHAIDLLTRPFNMHKKGVPEWLKNSREAYVRSGVDKRDDRNVVLHLCRVKGQEYLECIDFAGISGDDIRDKFIEWANPEAAKAGLKKVGLKPEDIEGGQGNGGKAYLREMFAQGYFVSTYDGKLSVVSFVDRDKHVLDFVPDELQGKDSEGDNPILKIRGYLGDWLKALGLAPDQNVTIVRGVLPKKPIDPDRLLEELQQFPQARQTIRTCKVAFYLNCEYKRDLFVKEPLLHSMFPKPVRIPIPPVIKHPDGYDIPTTRDPDFPSGDIELRVSAEPLRGVALSSWNRIDFHATGVSVIGFKKAEELPLQNATYYQHLFGSCTLPLLKDPKDNYEMQGRGELNEGPLSTALYHYIASEGDKLLSQLAKQAAGAQMTKKRKDLEMLHERLTKWIESKLTNIRGLSETGESEGEGGRRERKKREAKPHEPPASIKIHREKLDICASVSYPLRVLGFDAAKRPVPPGKVTWLSKDAGIASVHPEKGILGAQSAGMTYITATNDAGLTSNPLFVMVHEAVDLAIKTPSPVTVGSNRMVQLQVNVKTATGKSVPKDTVVSWGTDDDRVATIGPDGYLVGGEIGNTQVTAYAGMVESDPLDVVVEKGAAGKPRGGGKGRPRILLSGQDEDPFGEPSTILNPTDPPIYQRPYKPDHENNVFWINMQHPLAAGLFRKGVESVQWRTYHFHRIVDVYTTIELRIRFGDSQGLNVEDVLEEVQTIAAIIYKQAYEELFDVLFEEGEDLMKIPV